MFFFFFKYGMQKQQKHFLISGMIFLLFTAITGVAYIILGIFTEIYELYDKFILQSHAYLSLYGWKLSGILVIIRIKDFPLKFNSLAIILYHWLVIGIFAPLGKTFPLFSIISIITFSILLLIFFYGKEKVFYK